MPKDLITAALVYKGDWVTRGRISANWVACIWGCIAIFGGLWLFTNAYWALSYFFWGLGILAVADIVVFFIKRKGLSPISSEA